MNILARVHLYPPNHCAGAEMMLHELLKALVARGHRVQVHLSRFCPARAPYVRDGVEIFPRATADWQAEASKADVLMTHLDNTSTVISAALLYDKPLVQVLHNTHAPTRMWASCKNDLLIYNSDWMATELGRHDNGIVVRPPVWVADYEVEHPGFGWAATLVNLNEAKGGLIFAQLAALMGDTEFIGVIGAYGEQLLPHLPNVEIRPHGSDMRAVYQDTRVLLMPSSYESYGRVAVEAMCSGIPVIATDTPGLREALGDAGIFMRPGANALEWEHMVAAVLDAPDYDELAARGRARAADLCLLSQAEVSTFVYRVEALT
jgi:glycosyltransferase involved in cell wall biosynthesis